jgi:coniferyl-aldehyde dehydrogenase
MLDKTPINADPAAALEALRNAERRDGPLDVARRRELLRQLRQAIVKRADAFAEAIAEDFGGRARQETLISEVAVVLAGIDYALPRLARWSRPDWVWPGWRFVPAHGRVLKQPVGIVGIFAPWNYPVQLTLSPLIGALAAGCRAVVKPSEYVPATSALLADTLADLPGDVVRPILGGPDVAAAMSRQPFDKVLFTGSTETGRAVAKACAENLVPTVLELGGKSPAIIDRSADLAAATRDLIAGKLLNAGQTCVAPDYVFVPRDQVAAFVEDARKAATALFPDTERRDYTALVRPQDRARLQSLIDGSDTWPLFEPPLAAPRFTPCIVLNPAADSRLMREEIFGPVLPVVAYDDLDLVLAQIAARPTPLALYWFGRDAATKEKVLRLTRSGGVAINDTVMHVAVEALPFGGAGASGMGAYHGRAGFEAFTHRRAVFEQSALSLTRMLRPPYGDLAARILKSMIR